MRTLPQFMDDLDQPGTVQRETLARILALNRMSGLGQKLGFGRIFSDVEFRAQVPIYTYEDLRPAIEQQIKTPCYALSGLAPIHYNQTSGTTGQPKYVPLSELTLASFRWNQVISTEIQERTAPGMFAGNLLAIVSPVVEGYVHDTMPFGSMSGLVWQSLPDAIRARSVLPIEVSKIPDYESRYIVIAALALKNNAISCFASANPSTFLKLHEVIIKHCAALNQFLSSGNSADLGIVVTPEIREILTSPPISATRIQVIRAALAAETPSLFSTLWPAVKAVVTWTSGNCGLLIPKLRRLLSADVKIIDMGYMASEFWGSIIVDPAENLGVPTIHQNYFEFIEPTDWERGDRATRGIEEVEPGKQYFIIVTTPDGLYRYFINDIVEVCGRCRSTPLIRFAQKGKGVTSLTGEKVYEGQVIVAVQVAAAHLQIEVESFMLLCDRDDFSYVLYVESSAELDCAVFAQLFNQVLGENNIEYLGKVKSGRISAAVVRKVRPGTFEAYKIKAIQSGQREGQFKLIKLQYRDATSFKFQDFECP